jgi:hypothetical protein
MMIQRLLAVGISVAFLGLGVAGAEETMKSGQEKFNKQMSPEGNAMGVPVPGSTKDIESTEKQPDTSKIQSSKTLERLPNSIEGAILKIDGENYEIQGNMGDRVRLIVNNDTNLDCAAAPTTDRKSGTSDSMTSERLSAKDQAPQASDQQVAQGQRKDETARGSGFQIGKCDFKQGDVVKAEIDDNGRATTLKYLSDSSRSQGRDDMGMGQQPKRGGSGKQSGKH